VASDLLRLVRFIETRFNLEELRTLCLGLDVNYDNPAGETLQGKARELVLRLRREQRLDELLAHLREARPEAFASAGLGTAKDIDPLSSKGRPVWLWVAGTVLGLVLLAGSAWGIRSAFSSLQARPGSTLSSRSTFAPTSASTPIGEPTPTHTSTYAPTPTNMPAATFTPTSTPTPTFADCEPSDLSELLPQSIAVIESLESGAKSQAAFSTLRYEYASGLKLASGITIDFRRMKRFELSNPDFTRDFAADVKITFLDCTTHRDRIQSQSGSYLAAETEFGPLQLHILKVKRVDFEW
jgi:hypothetical protein